MPRTSIVRGIMFLGSLARGTAAFYAAILDSELVNANPEMNLNL